MGASPTLLPVISMARISSVCSSTPMWILRHRRRFAPPCLRACHSRSPSAEICAKVGDACSDGVLNVAEPVAKLNPFDDLWQAVLAVEFAPFLLRRPHQPEGHGQTGPAAEAPLGAFRAVPDGSEGALDRI